MSGGAGGTGRLWLAGGWPGLVTTARSSNTGLLVLALAVGVAAGAGAIVFRWLIDAFTLLFSGQADYSTADRAAHPQLEVLGPWFVVAVPVVAGLLYGPLIHFWCPEARGGGVPEVMDAVARRGGRIRPRVAVAKTLASALCIGGGGSVGREGPIVQIASALGSTVGRLVRVPEPRLRVLVACGAAGGVAATFNAPLAGVFFAMELILVDFAAQSFGMVVLSAVTASVVGRTVLGDDLFLELPRFDVAHVAEFGLFAVLGLLAGVVGVAFTKVLSAVEDGCDALWRGPEWLRPAAGGVLLGLVLLVLPQMYGVGYPVLGAAVAGTYGVGFLLVLLVGKVLATSLSIGIGGVGGVFGPSLFVGAMLGAAFGEVVATLAPDIAGPVGAYGLIGMGAVFAGAARAPITAVIVLFELTGEYSIILPLMAAIALATGAGHKLSPDTIYTVRLRRRGVVLGSRQHARPAGALPVSLVMEAVPPPVHGGATMTEAAGLLAHSTDGVLPVTGPDGVYLGTITSRAVAEMLAVAGHEDDAVHLLVEMPPRLRESDLLDDGLSALDRSGTGAVPVLDDERAVLVGWLSQRAALDALRRPAAEGPDTVGGA